MPIKQSTEWEVAIVERGVDPDIGEYADIDDLLFFDKKKDAVECYDQFEKDVQLWKIIWKYDPETDDAWRHKQILIDEK